MSNEVGVGLKLAGVLEALKNANIAARLLSLGFYIKRFLLIAWE